MASAVCRGLETCFEPRPVEPAGLRHKLSPPKSLISQPLSSPQNSNLFDKSKHEDDLYNKNNTSDNGDLKTITKRNESGWNFIQALTNPSYNTKEVTKEVYVHPLVKRSALALTSKGLEMCTESLGSETGSDTSSDEISSFSWEREKMQLPTDEKVQQLNEFSSLSCEAKNKYRSSYRKYTKLHNPKSEFPPPLTSISGSDRVEVRPHREGGCLIINAVAVSSCRTYFKADRTNGRLRLSVLKECSVHCDCDTNKNSYEEVHDNEDNEDEEAEVLGSENVCELTEDENSWSEEMEGNKSKVGRETGIGEFPRPSRCKETGRGSKEISNWGPFWVAIS